MSRYDDYGYFPPYVSVGEKKAKAAKALEKIRKKKGDVAPIIIEGRKIAKSWWGKAWCDNLENYADYDNRIGRGRSYVRHGCVLDLKICAGEVTALVQGSSRKPYQITVKISKMNQTVWHSIQEACSGKIETLSALIEGKFPEEMAELFTLKGKGLFPSPREIQFGCSCPDWASMCKHVAAVLYGIGARLDNDPSLFFTLRQADINELVSRAVMMKSEALLSKAKKKTGRVIEDSDISKVFGIDLDQASDDNKKGGRKAKSSVKTRGKKNGLSKP